MGDYTELVNRYAIQTWYKLKVEGETPKLSCDEVIKIPLDLSIINEINEPTRMTPCVAITTEYQQFDELIKIEIETNEGFIIEPIKVASESLLHWAYILTLPPKTTGLKNVKVFAVDNGHPIMIQNNLTFDIMQPPYDYTGAALDSVSRRVLTNNEAIIDIDTRLDDLTARVVALENKAGT